MLSIDRLHHCLLICLFFALCLPVASWGQSMSSKNQDGRKVNRQEYLRLADSEAVKKRFRQASWYLNEVAMKCWEDNQYDSAVLLFNRSLEYNQNIDNQQGIFGIYSNLAMIHADMASYEKAVFYFEKTLEGRRKRGEKVGVIAALINLSVVLNQLKKHQAAAGRLEEALELAKEMNDPEQMRSCYGMLSETYEKAGDMEKSLDYFDLYKTFHELVQREKEQGYKQDVAEAKLRAQMLEIEKKQREFALELKQRELAKKERELQEISGVLAKFGKENQELLANASKSEILQELLKSQNSQMAADLEAQNLRLERKNLVTQALGIGTILLIIIVSLVLFYSRQKRKQNEKLQAAIVAEQQSRVQAQEALIQLQKAQTQLIHQEKMASLGQLTAGIAHEINNPLNFIYSGISVLKSEKEVYDEILGDYQKLKELEGDEFKASLSAIWEKEEVLEVAESQEEMDYILNSMDEGASRVKEIVQSLQYFSRQRHMAPSMADMHQCLDSTLMLLSNVIQDKVEIRKSYDEKLPDIECFPSQINQVLMNLIVNAVQATEGQEQRWVELKTVNHPEYVEVAISDSGQGIKDEHLSSIFNPFFTTKEVGKGMGLGLSISYGIVQEHGGELNAENAHEAGAIFKMMLPKEQPHAVE